MALNTFENKIRLVENDINKVWYVLIEAEKIKQKQHAKLKKLGFIDIKLANCDAMLFESELKNENYNKAKNEANRHSNFDVTASQATKDYINYLKSIFDPRD
jgi:hypothetical protein